MWKTLSAQRKKAAILLTLLFAVTLVALACRRDNDYFDYTIQGVDFSADPEECAVINEDYGILTVDNDTGAEVIVKAENLLLTPGTYDYDFQYELDGNPSHGCSLPGRICTKTISAAKCLPSSRSTRMRLRHTVRLNWTSR